MPVMGLGCDIIEIARIETCCRRSAGFTRRIFTMLGQRQCDSHGSKYQHYAGKFAAKEAVGKAIGRPLSWQDVELISSASGKPEVHLHGEALKAAEGFEISVSISHSRDYAVAVAVMEERT